MEAPVEQTSSDLKTGLIETLLNQCAKSDHDLQYMSVHQIKTKIEATEYVADLKSQMKCNTIEKLITQTLTNQSLSNQALFEHFE
jgi:hypothetical protein